MATIDGRVDADWAGIAWEPRVATSQTDGAALSYVDHGEGPPIVLLHGMGACWQWWLEVLPAMASSHRVIAVDLPGFGASDPVAADADLAEHAGRVADLLRRLGLSDAVVVGHSMGGLVAMALTRDHPDVVGRLVLVGSGGFPMTPRRLSVVLTFLRLTYAAFTRAWVLRWLIGSARARGVLMRSAMVRPAALSDELAGLIVPMFAAPGFLPAIEASARAVASSDPTSIRVPTLLLWGEKDRFAPLAAARDLHRLIPDCRLEIIVGVGHSPMIEAPREFREALLRFADAAAAEGAGND